MLLSLFILSVVEWSIIPAQVSYGLVWSKAIQQVLGHFPMGAERKLHVLAPGFYGKRHFQNLSGSLK